MLINNSFRRIVKDKQGSRGKDEKSPGCMYIKTRKANDFVKASRSNSEQVFPHSGRIKQSAAGEQHALPWWVVACSESIGTSSLLKAMLKASQDGTERPKQLQENGTRR